MCGLLLSTAALTQIATRAKLSQVAGPEVDEIRGVLLERAINRDYRVQPDLSDAWTQFCGPRPVGRGHEHAWQLSPPFETARDGKAERRRFPVRFDIAVGVVAHRLQLGRRRRGFRNFNSVEHHDDDRTEGTDSAWRKELRRAPRDASMEHSGGLQRRDRLPRSSHRPS